MAKNNNFIQPVKHTILVSDIRSVWHTLKTIFSNKLSLARSLMDLFYGDGVSFMMSPEGLYLCGSFNQLAKHLHMKNPHELIRAVEESTVFIVGKGNNSYGVPWFASPLYLDEKALVKAMQAYEAPDMAQAPAYGYEYSGTLFDQQLQDGTPKLDPLNSIIYNTGIDNIILSGRKSCDSSRLEGEEKKAVTIVEKKVPTLTTAEKENIVNEFLKLMFQNKEFFERLRHCLMDEEVDGKPRRKEDVFDEAQAHEILVELIYRNVKPYFVQNDSFFTRTTSFEGRRNWLYNLIYGKNGQSIIKRAIGTCRRRWKAEQQKAFSEQQKASCKTLPGLSAYEWKDATGQRYYNDSMNGTTAIPADAAPRPNETSNWNKYTNNWI